MNKAIYMNLHNMEIRLTHVLRLRHPVSYIASQCYLAVRCNECPCNECPCNECPCDECPCNECRSLQWMSSRWMSSRWMPLQWMSLQWMSLRWMSLQWMSLQWNRVTKIWPKPIPSRKNTTLSKRKTIPQCEKKNGSTPRSGILSNSKTTNYTELDYCGK